MMRDHTHDDLRLIMNLQMPVMRQCMVLYTHKGDDCRQNVLYSRQGTSCTRDEVGLRTDFVIEGLMLYIGRMRHLVVELRITLSEVNPR